MSEPLTREILSQELEKFHKGILLDMKNLMLERDKEIGQVLGKQDTKIALLDHDLTNLKTELRHYMGKSDEFKKEVRDNVRSLTETDNKQTGALGFGRWILSTGIFGGAITVITLLYKAFL